MGGSERTFGKLVDELVEASRVARSLLTELRSDMKDMRTLLKQYRAIRDEMATVIADVIRASIQAEVDKQVTELGTATEKAMAEAVTRVNSEFDKLANLMLSGDPKGRGTPMIDLMESAGMVTSLQPVKGCRHPISFHGGGHTNCRAMGCNCPGWSEHDGE